MPLKGIPARISPELLYTLAKMGHGDFIVIADANFPSDSVAASTRTTTPIRLHGRTDEVLGDILQLMPLDSYSDTPIIMMDRVDKDKARDLHVPAYGAVGRVAGGVEATLMERFSFYRLAKEAFAVVQTDDTTLYANVIVYKGVIS